MRASLAAKRRQGSVLARITGVRSRIAGLLGGGIPDVVTSVLTEGFSRTTSWARSGAVTEYRGSLGENLVALSGADWDRLTDTLLPRIAPAAKAAQALLHRRPYLDGLTRQSFRCPGSPQTLADGRARWLLHITLLLGEYDADIRWIAEHAAYLAEYSGGPDIGWLLAGAIDAGGADGAAVFEILRSSANGEHATAQMGRHVVQALLSCANPDAWAVVERMLLAAQREEGLRQVILESVDEAHPDAYRRMLRLILDHDLTRFSSVVRAADTWFAFLWDGSSTVKVETILKQVLACLDDATAVQTALASPDAEAAYLALWSLAFEDVDRAIAPAAKLLQSEHASHRFVATHFLAQSCWTTAVPLVMHALGDEDMRVAARALDLFQADLTKSVDGVKVFDNIEALLQRMPKRAQKLEPVVWPWYTQKLERPKAAAALATNAGAVSTDRLLPYVPSLDPYQRESFIRRAAGLLTRWAPRTPDSQPQKPLSATERGVVLDLLGDTSEGVRRAAFEALGVSPVKPDEMTRLIDLLARKPGDLRNGALARLRTLPDASLLDASDRLLHDPQELRRLAGLELLRDAVEAGRCVTDARDRLAQYAADRPALSEPERAHVDAVADDAAPVASTDDALGLLAGRRQPDWAAPRPLRIREETPAAAASLASLASLILEHQTTEVRTADGEMRLLVESAVPAPGAPTRVGDPSPQPPLFELWYRWFERRDDALRDHDGFEFLRLLVSDGNGSMWSQPAPRTVSGLGQWSGGRYFLRRLVEWCAVWSAPAGGAEFLLDGLESSLAALTVEDRQAMTTEQASVRRHYYHTAQEDAVPWRVRVRQVGVWLAQLRWWCRALPGNGSDAIAMRLYALLRHAESTTGGYESLQPTLPEFLAAYRTGSVDVAEFTDFLVGRWSTGRSARVKTVSTLRPPKELEALPELLDVVQRCRTRIVDVECTRGDRLSAASHLAMELRFTGGLDTLQRAVPALGSAHFARNVGWYATAASRQDTLSHLVRRSMPRPEDTHEAFAAWVSRAGIRETRLVELALYAPQWAPHVARVLDWDGLESAVWWFQAHTKDDRSWEIRDLKELWAAEISEHTPLTASDLTEGAVDVSWFGLAYARLGAARWKALDTAAKYASTAGGHTRAQLFARAMSGIVTVGELTARIAASRHQDSVRALGLVPLAAGADAESDLLTRYRAIEEFRRESRQFGAQRRESESRAVDIALANLARTAGYQDPQRLRWAMERAAVGDLAAGPVIVTREDVTITLAIDEDGVPSLTVARRGKTLKTMPAAMKKDAEPQELVRRHQELKRQRSRVREALEQAMCRDDHFTPVELRTLCEHPILAPALTRLVFVGDGIAGYLVEGGHALRDAAGAIHALGTTEALRIAHPADLLARGDWSAWQRECFAAERVQPFKQVFREMYPITAAERDTNRSRRYAGHQVNPRQALALLGGRGWVARPEEGVSRTDHDAGMTIRLGFQETFYTPADVEGLTLDEIVFTKKGEWHPLDLASVSPRLFSEAMRDLDLVVSVAHSGGVDPEATASTVGMRASLIEETCALLGLRNVELSSHHAIIRGALADYSVHLGSANVLVLPATSLPIVAVQGQHRGRLFLPFADDDPRTAEVLSKVLLLSRDTSIRDPNILETIRAARGAMGA